MFAGQALEYPWDHSDISDLSRINFQRIPVQNNQVGLFPNLDGSHFLLNTENLSSGGSDPWVKWYFLDGGVKPQ